MMKSRRDIVYMVLVGVFIANAILAETIGGKLIQVGPFVMSIGVIPWPFVFITTDLINEYFGVQGVRRITLLTAALIGYCFIILFFAMALPSAAVSPVKDEPFRIVFGQSMWIIVGSLCAFLASQLVDVIVFWYFRKRTGGRMLWLRATGSTAASQLIDTFVIIGIAFWLPGKLNTFEFFNLSLTNYVYKFLIAVAATPLIYASHSLIDHWLAESRQNAQ